MQKIACIFSFKMSSWVSCQKIVFNLHKTYHINKDVELLNFNYSVHQTTDDIIKTSLEIAESRPDTILILDHKPHPHDLLKLVLADFEKTKHKPRFIFHIFGDFTLYYELWNKLGKLLEGYQVDFVVASDRQKNLIDKFLIPPLSSYVCPFPVDKHEFSYNPALRKLQRADWGLQDDDLVFVFTGRLSRQKRIHTVLKAFSEFLEKSKSTRAHLFLYGDTDHLGDQFVGRWETEGQYFRKINRIYKSLPARIQKQIHFMGSVPNIELKSVYQGADYLLNMSVHNDEDFGMSVAEALCSGLPAILTDWGGLASFKLDELPFASRFVPVKIGIRDKQIKYEAILQELNDALERGSLKNRKEISEAAMEKFGIDAAHLIVDKVINSKTPKFEGFSPFFEKVLARYNFTGTPYINDRKNINKLYREIYSSYVGTN